MVNVKQLISVIKKTPVSYKWLKSRVPENVTVYRYRELHGKNRYDVFKGKIGIVVLIPKRNQKVGHWIVMLPKKNHIEYFSSLGNSFETEAKMLGVNPNIIQNIVGNNYIYNRVKLQKAKYTIQDCAVFVLLRLKFHKMKLREFTQLFSRKIILESSDDIAAFMGMTLVL